LISQLDILADRNGLRSLPPEQKLIFATALFLLGYLSPPIVQLLITLWLAIWTVVYAKIPPLVYGRLLTLPLGFLVTSLPALMFGITRDPILIAPDRLWGVSYQAIEIYLSQQGLAQAQALIVRAIALTTCLYFVLLTIPFREILRIMRRWGCPLLLTELMLLMYRFIFLLAATASELLTAQQSRLGYRSWRIGMNSLAILIGQLLQRTLMNYRQIALGLASRGYTGELRVWHRCRYRTQWRYVWEAIGGYSVLLSLTVWHYCKSWFG